MLTTTQLQTQPETSNHQQMNSSRQSSTSPDGDRATTRRSPYSILWQRVRRLFSLEVDNAKLLMADKLTVLLSQMAFWAVVFVIGTAIALFLTIGVASLLLKSMAAHWVYICIAAFYIVVLAIVAALRHRLFVDPIARFVSRLILDPKAFSSSSSSAADSTLSSTDSTASLSDTNL
jgi:hypothetical protein